MKTLRILLSIALLFTFFDTIAQTPQIKPNHIKIKKKPLINPNVKPAKTYTARGTQSAVQTVARAPENMCKPLNLNNTEDILKNRIGRNLSLVLDKDYSSLSILGRTVDLDISSYKVSKVGNDWTYYLNDIKSNLVRINYTNGNYEMVIYFESERTELKGFCHGCRVGNSDNRAPDIHWENPAIKIILKPEAFENSLILQPYQIGLMGDFELGGLSDTFFPVITAHFKRRIEGIMREKLIEIFSSREVKTMISNALKPEVDLLGIGSVKRVDLSNTQLYLCNY